MSEHARVSLVSLAREGDPVSLGIRLLSDLRAVFETHDTMFTAAILEKLCSLEESPWAELKGRPVTARDLSRLLKHYGVASKQIRIGPATAKGYTRADLCDPWSRYLGSPSAESETSVTTGTAVRGHVKAGIEGEVF